MSHNLKVLADHREALLLAEVAAWLHDYRKCSDEHLQTQSANISGAQGLARNELLNRHPQLASTSLALVSDSVSISDLLKWDHSSTRQGYGWLGQYVVRCHHTAHFDKQEPDDGKQNYPSMYSGSPFGYERSTVPVGLTQRLWNQIPWSKVSISPFAMSERNAFYDKVKKLFSETVADTRRPINEIALWEWGHTVGALYKAALAGALLGFQPRDANALRWRLLSVRLDGLSFFADVHRLPDLLARRELLIRALGKVQELLEVEYPLGTEVYRDEDGSVFVVPGCEKHNCTLDLLSLDDGTGKTLQDHILGAVYQVLDGESVPKVNLDVSSWWGQDPNWRNKQRPDDELPPVAGHTKPVVITADPAWVARQWEVTEQICIVCGLRPQGPRQKAKERGVCDVCEERRADRAKEWATGRLHTTIWTDEVADDNGRLALVVGQFALKHWLDGSLVRTLAVRDPASEPTRTAEAIAKNPSFARIRRVWETTRTFWQEIKEQIQDGTLIPLKGHRLAITSADAGALDLGPFHVYELVVKGIRLSVVWDKAKGRFVAADNLDYLASPEQLDQPVGDVVQPGRQFRLEEPTGYGGANRNLGAITMDAVERIEQPYPPVIPILAEPRTFMALVPANKSLAVASAIKVKYEREMGKVRNRLPLHLGIVYAHRRTPLRAILDAGRRMLRRPSQIVQAEVVDISPVDPWPAAVDVTLCLDEREITVAVPTVMGDGTTHDVWYPYWQVAGKPTDRTRWFIGPDGEHWVHVTDLRQGDRVQFTPSTFDFEYLDTSARRFEVAYNDNGQRRGADRRQRPYLLDEVDMLQNIWRTLQKHTTNAQIHALVELVEAKREEWHPLLDDETFHRFCRDVLANIEWRESPWGADRNSWLDTWLDYAVRGWIADTVELHHHVMRQR